MAGWGRRRKRHDDMDGGDVGVRRAGFTAMILGASGNMSALYNDIPKTPIDNAYIALGYALIVWWFWENRPRSDDRCR